MLFQHRFYLLLKESNLLWICWRFPQKLRNYPGQFAMDMKLNPKPASYHRLCPLVCGDVLPGLTKVIYSLPLVGMSSFGKLYLIKPDDFKESGQTWQKRAPLFLILVLLPFRFSKPVGSSAVEFGWK